MDLPKEAPNQQGLGVQDQPTGEKVRFTGQGKLVQQSEHFVLLEIPSPVPAHVMLLREELVSKVAASSDMSLEDAAKMTAGQLFSITRGLNTKDEIVRAGAEIFKKSWAMKFDRASAAVQIQGLPSSWETPIFAVSWPR